MQNKSAMVKSWITYPCIRRWPCRWLFFESSRRTYSRREPSCRNCRRRTASSSSLPASMGASSDREQRGHRIRYHGNGAYCVKCGKQTARLEHLNTRILQQPCLYPDLPPSSWVQLPGKMNATARFDAMQWNTNWTAHTIGSFSTPWFGIGNWERTPIAWRSLAAYGAANVVAHSLGDFVLKICHAPNVQPVPHLRLRQNGYVKYRKCWEVRQLQHLLQLNMSLLGLRYFLYDPP